MARLSNALIKDKPVMFNHAKTHLCKHIYNQQSILTKDSFQNGPMLQLWQITHFYPSKRFRNWRVHQIGIVENNRDSSTKLKDANDGRRKINNEQNGTVIPKGVLLCSFTKSWFCFATCSHAWWFGNRIIFHIIFIITIPFSPAWHKRHD